MKKKLLLTFASITLFFCATAQTTVTISATGTAGSFNTGSVNSAGTKNDGNMININSTTNAGFAKYDLSGMPAGATIMSVSCAFTTYSTTSSGASNNLYGFIGNPATIPGTNLYSNCTTGTSLNTSTWTANATNTKILNASGVTFVQTNVYSPQLCIGYARASTNNYNIHGYPGTAAQQPKLIITYSITPCSGTPNAGTVVATSTTVCPASTVTLNLSGSTIASGLTYQWQSSPDNVTWTSIPTATTLSTAQTINTATYFQCIVACATNTAVSTSIFVNITSPPIAGTISGPANVNSGTINSYTISPSVGNIQWYVSTTPTGPLSSITSATTAINQTITAVGSGTVYYTVIASAGGCTSDTSNVRYPVNINFPGDNVCDAIPLSLGVSTVSYSINGATTQTGEVAPPATGFSTNTGWGNSTLSNTRWFTFVAPASGYVTVQAPDFDAQLAVWKAASCSDLLSASTATLIAANDDDANNTANGGVLYSSFLRAACLTPGATYYIQLDSYDTPALANSSTRVLVMDMGAPLNASYSGLAANYCLPAASSSLTPAVNGGIFTINTSTTSVTSFVPSTAGTFTVMYSIYSCKTTSTTVVANTPTVMAMTSNTSVCSGSSATLTASGATNYTWTAGGNASTEVVTPTVASVYTVTGESSGCSNSTTVSVGVIANPTVMAMTSNTAVCSGSSATLTASGATNYTWTSGGTNSTEVVTPTAASVYTVTGETSGCSNSTTVSVGVTASPSVMAMTSNASVCAGSSATLSAMGATNYTWTSGGTASTEVVTPTGNTTYTLTGEANGCVGYSTISVGVNQIPTVSASATQTLLCDDGSTGSSILTASSTATSFAWSNGATTMSISVTPTATTVYTVTATDAGCSSNAFVTVTVSNCNGIKESIVNGISIYPNPTNGVLNIAISSDLAGSSTVEVYDAIGKLVIKDVLSNDTNTINLSKLEDGMYVFKIINNNKAIKIGKVVKQ